MHIASGDLWAGAEVQLFTLAKFQAARDDTQLHVVLMNEGELAERLRELPLSLTILDESQLSAWAIFLQLRQLMLSWQPEVVHTHRQKENVLGGLANTRLLSGRPISGLGVRTVHGDSEFAIRFWRKPAKWAFAKLDYCVGRFLQGLVISVSDELAEKLSARFGGDKVRVVLNGVDVDALAAIDSGAFGEAHGDSFKHIGFVGRLEPVKRVDIFLQVAQLAAAEADNEWCFHVFGDGGLMPELKQQAEDLGVAGLVSFHGHRSDIASCIKAMDALVMCSDHEGLPMTALEAVALDVPMVAHAVGGLPKLLENGGGCVLASQSPSDYFSVLKQMFNGELAALDSSNTLAEQYRAKYNAECLIGLYRDKIASHKKAR